jgi:signal transduction histidine kinase/ActR/RegA family two-component response regulator
MDVCEMATLQFEGRRASLSTGSMSPEPQPQSGVGFVMDPTERRQAETDRTGRRVSEPNDRAKTEFLTTMSHELRTPLNAILGYAQCLDMDSGLNERQRRSVKAIHASGEHLLSLIVDILDLSQIEADRLELVPAPVALQPFLRSVAEIMRGKADEGGLILALNAACDLPDVVVIDERRLRQVLLNLLGNAVKFTDRGAVSLSASVEAREHDHSLVRIEVCDTGVGMRPEELATIFEPFKQVGDVRRREAGTGLGLTITRALIAAMGSDIRVTSELGRGTQFSFVLRMKHGEPRQPSGSTQSSPGYEGHRRRVLVIDDVAHSRSLFADFLSSIGFECRVAENGLQGIEEVNKFLPDLVLMDTVMPVMSGLEATQRLRADPACAHLPIIAVSANATREHELDCLEAGANVCLSKPVRLDELASAIQQLLRLVPKAPSGW